MKVRPVAAEVFHTDGRVDRQTDRQKYMTKLTVAFRSFTKVNVVIWFFTLTKRHALPESRLLR